MEASSATSQEKDKDKDLDVNVFAPKDPNDVRSYTFDKHMSVGDAAGEAARDFGYEGGQPTFIKDGKALDRTKSLVAEHVRDGDVLEILDAGGGV